MYTQVLYNKSILYIQASVLLLLHNNSDEDTILIKSLITHFRLHYTFLFSLNIRYITHSVLCILIMFSDQT